MNHRVILIIISILILLGCTLSIKHIHQERKEAVRLELHPLSTTHAQEEAEKLPVETWKQWIEKWTEINLGGLVQDMPTINTHQLVEQKRKEIRLMWEEVADTLRGYQDLPPQPGEPIYSRSPTIQDKYQVKTQ